MRSRNHIWILEDWRPAQLFVLASVFLLSSCYNTRYLQEGELLYKDSNIDLVGIANLEDTAALDDSQATEVKLSKREKKAIAKADEQKNRASKTLAAELKSLERHKANQRLLGAFETKLWLHNEMSQREEGFFKTWLTNERRLFGLKPLLARIIYPKDEPGFRNWIQKNFTEPPVLLDSNVILETSSRMEAYLNNRGYFNPEVAYETELKDQRATVNYKVNLNDRFRIRKIIYQIEDSTISHMVDPQLVQLPPEMRRRMLKNLPLKQGEGFELKAFKAERKRIQLILQDSGYYAFDRSYVEFDLDSSATSKQLDVYVKVRPPTTSGDHQRYYVGDIIIEPSIGLASTEDSTFYEGITLIGNDGRFRPALLKNAIAISSGQPYSATDHAITIRRMTELGAFKFVSINYRERRDDDSLLLDAIIRLTPMKKQGWSAELNANTKFKISPLGSDIKFVYKNRNLFHNADLFTFDLSAGLGTQFDTTLLNSFDLTASAALDIPKFLLPVRMQRGWKVNRPSTSFQASYQYTRRLEFYTLNSTSFIFSYRWNRSSKIAHRLSPVDLSFVGVSNTTNIFDSILVNNPLLNLSFEEQFIPGASYTFLYNNGSINRRNDGVFLRTQVGIAGNLLNPILKQVLPRPGNNELFGTPVSQFVRVEGDFRYYYRPQKDHELVLRTAAGIGVAYGNSDVLPYIRQFYTGGASAIRAWRIRRLGPGSFAPEYNPTGGFIDRTGDINIEGNLEYRFPIYSLLKGAFFIDAGNIWLMGEDTTQIGGDFTRDWATEIAIGTGFGLRADFEFFVFRADLGIPVRDPAYPKRFGQRWVITNWGNNEDAITNRLVYNVAIGYPF